MKYSIFLFITYMYIPHKQSYSISFISFYEFQPFI